MALDARPVFRGDDSAYTRPVGAGRPVAGGVDFDGSLSCSGVKNDGDPCGAHASADGLCAGHRRQARARQGL